MDKEMTVREALLLVIDKSPQEFERLKVLLKQASDAFDMADDQTGLRIISDELFPLIRGLAEFCTSIFDYHLAILGEDVGFEFCEKIKRLNELLAELARETSDGNFTEIGDILRFDMFDFINDLEAFFPQVQQCFRESDSPSLDKT